MSKKFRYLEETISTKLGWSYYIKERLGTIRKVYNTMQLVFRTIRKREIKFRKKIFFAYALSHFLWLFCTWFFFTHGQNDRVEHTCCYDLRILHNLRQ